MNPQDSILRLKGWQVFVLLQLSSLVSIGFALVPFLRGDAASPYGMPYRAFAVLEASYFGWLLTVGAAMNSQLRAGLRRRWWPPAVGLAFAVVYLLFASSLFSLVRQGNAPPLAAWGPHLLSMAVNFYLLWYAGRALVAAEESRRPPLDRVLGTFFVLWFTIFLPIGAWWVQTRARRVAATS
jgi:hypothetical protein